MFGGTRFLGLRRVVQHSIQQANKRRNLTVGLARTFTSDSVSESLQKEDFKSDDPYDRYRRAPTLSILTEIKHENVRTSEELGRVKTDLYMKMFDAISQATVENGRAINEECCPGPTGRYFYKWTQLEKSKDDHHCAYQRYNVDDPSQSLQLVLDMGCQQFSDLIDMSLSVDESMLAYVVRNVDTSLEVWIRQIETGHVVRMGLAPATPGTKPGNFVSVEFGAVRKSSNKGHDEHSLFLVAADAHGRPDRVYAICVNPEKLFDEKRCDPRKDVKTSYFALTPRKLYETNDPKVHVDLQRTKGCQFVAMNARTQSSNKVCLIRHYDDDMKLVRGRENGVQYHVDVGRTKEDIFVLASSGLKKRSSSLGIEPSVFQSSTMDLPLRSSFGKLLSPTSIGSSSEYAIFDFDIFQDYIAYYERSTRDVAQRVRIANRQLPDDEWIVPIPSDQMCLAMLSPGGNMNYMSNSILFHVESAEHVRKTFEYNMSTKELKLLSKNTTVADTRFTKRRVFVPSKDGTKIPLSLVHLKDLTVKEQEGKLVKTILIGYGAYGKSVNLAFDPALQPLLNSGFTLAFAHSRGGSELGQSWHLRGRGLEKPRAVEDYLACAEALTSGSVFEQPVELTAKAFSAGGVIVGAAVNQRPELFRKVVLTNAFLDLDATMKNTSLHLTEHEWDEYGNPLKDEVAADSIRSICPVSNIHDYKKPPRFLIIGTLDDEQVPYWNAVIYGKKLVAKSQANVYLYIENEGGHQLQTKRLQVAAMEATFIAGDE